MELTVAQEAQIKQVMAAYPFRIVWAMIDKDTGTFEVFASTDKRQMNKAARQGHQVFVVSKERK